MLCAPAATAQNCTVGDAVHLCCLFCCPVFVVALQTERPFFVAAITCPIADMYYGEQTQAMMGTLAQHQHSTLCRPYLYCTSRGGSTAERCRTAPVASRLFCLGTCKHQLGTLPVGVVHLSLHIFTASRQSSCWAAWHVHHNSRYIGRSIPVWVAAPQVSLEISCMPAFA